MEKIRGFWIRKTSLFKVNAILCMVLQLVRFVNNRMLSYELFKLDRSLYPGGEAIVSFCNIPYMERICASRHLAITSACTSTRAV